MRKFIIVTVDHQCDENSSLRLELSFVIKIPHFDEIPHIDEITSFIVVKIYVCDAN